MAKRTKSTQLSNARKVKRSGAIKVKRSGARKVKRSGARKVKRSGARKVKRSGARKVKRSGTKKGVSGRPKQPPRKGPRQSLRQKNARNRANMNNMLSGLTRLGFNKQKSPKKTRKNTAGKMTGVRKPSVNRRVNLRMNGVRKPSVNKRHTGPTENTFSKLFGSLKL